MKFKALLFAALSSAILLSSCGSTTDDREIASVASYSSELEFYDRFSNAEVENMAFSKLGLFSLTCDYDTRDIRIYKAGDEIEVLYKLTNMTGMTIDAELQIAGGSSIDDMAWLYISDENRNPIATGWSEEKTFLPYETYEIPIKLTVPDGAAEKSCHLAAGIGIQVFNDDIIERMQLNYCSVSMSVMYVPVTA